jgi:hypothetical protein
VQIKINCLLPIAYCFEGYCVALPVTEKQNSHPLEADGFAIDY